MIRKICTYCGYENPYIDGSCMHCGRALNGTPMHWIVSAVITLAVVGLWFWSISQ